MSSWGWGLKGKEGLKRRLVVEVWCQRSGDEGRWTKKLLWERVVVWRSGSGAGEGRGWWWIILRHAGRKAGEKRADMQ